MLLIIFWLKPFWYTRFTHGSHYGNYNLKRGRDYKILLILTRFSQSPEEIKALPLIVWVTIILFVSRCRNLKGFKKKNKIQFCLYWPVVTCPWFYCAVALLVHEYKSSPGKVRAIARQVQERGVIKRAVGHLTENKTGRSVMIIYTLDANS